MRVEASQDYQSFDPGAGKTPYDSVALVTEQSVSWLDVDQVWRAEVRVECWPGPEVVVPYRFRLQAIGGFVVREGVVPPEEVETFVSCNATAVLFASCREALKQLTMQGPYAAVELPLIFFTVSKAEVPSTVEDPLEP